MIKTSSDAIVIAHLVSYSFDKDFWSLEFPFWVKSKGKYITYLMVHAVQSKNI